MVVVNWTSIIFWFVNAFARLVDSMIKLVFTLIGQKQRATQRQRQALRTAPSGGPKVPPPPREPSASPPPAWYPDPSRRHPWRWWDGYRWTDHVAAGGPPFVDPVPPKR